MIRGRRRCWSQKRFRRSSGSTSWAGVAKRIARELGISRNTAKDYIAAGGWTPYRQPQRKKKALTQFGLIKRGREFPFARQQDVRHRYVRCNALPGSRRTHHVQKDRTGSWKLSWLAVSVA